MTLRSALLAAPLALMLTPPLLAAPATPEGAARIMSAFDAYTGGIPGLVTAVPVGESYRLTFDAAPLVRMLAEFIQAPPGDEDGVDQARDMMRAMRIDPVVLELTEQGGGRWGVRQDQDWQVAVDMPGVGDLKYSFPISVDAVWDEALLDFSSFRSTMTGSRSVQRQYQGGRPLLTIEDTTARAVTEASARPGANGGVDMESRAIASDQKQSFRLHYGQPGPDSVQGTFAVNTAIREFGTDISVTGMRRHEIAGLWRWLVAQRGAENIVLGQEELRASLRAALPLLERARITAPFQGVSVDSAVFDLALDKLRVEFETTGLTSDGQARVALAFEGVTPPRLMLVEPWSVPLVPDRMTFEMKLSQIDPGALAVLVVDTFDLTADAPFARVTPQAARAALLPEGALRIELAPGGIEADDYRVSWFGNLDIAPDAAPTGAIRFEATGLDTVERKLSEAVGPTARDALDRLRALRAGAEKRDGRDVWTIDAALLAEAGAALDVPGQDADDGWDEDGWDEQDNGLD